jgi:hypothetical protein
MHVKLIEISTLVIGMTSEAERIEWVPSYKKVQTIST